MAQHVSDPYVRRSVKENYRARSAFKLIEINNMYKFLEPGHAVIDMGAAPGAWSQVLVKEVNARITKGKKAQPPSQQQLHQTELLHPKEITSFHKANPDLKCGIVIALDRNPIFEMPGAHIIDDWNLTEETTNDCNKRLHDLLNRLKIDKVDGILSDMCPNVTGCKEMDHAAIVILQRQALDFTRRLLKTNGYFLCKLFQGQDTFQEMRSLLESIFRIVHLVKPSASREQSPEMYLLGLKYCGDASNTLTPTDNNNNNPRIETNQDEIKKLLAEARRIRTKKNEK
ncbi:unnamed protein product [Rotaria magnacalcarata]|uniref:rRNA methyltransferase 2, mitochondrial n=4 Tax=Rotaria magnacalcarata TaxID=392030 RepID=A0A816YU88_9BILA|nr:unnamed protein product [Rotaria magnacalcarata]CAF1669260.1 unnamed protein product [Rotaria magnacalcarata]CAF2161210.1 unnamed protein product [Rotaria magnacalcarata]CAF2168586.1 unnamed protein product [Rotaria magnacalcarata]CAF2189279.1 unnamed protein product [Rotaria magnacalcarata]